MQARVVLKLSLVALVACASPFAMSEVAAQSHHPADISLVIRDQQGAALDPAKFVVTSPKGEELKPGLTWGKPVEGKKEKNVKCLVTRLELGGRPVKLSEVTLKHGEQTMRLLVQGSVIENHLVIDTPPFRAGTFKREKSGWSEVQPEAAKP